MLLTLGWQVSRSFFSTQEQEIRSDIRHEFEESFAEMATASQRRYGLVQINQSNEESKNVILIHGLDDPGKVWMNLAPRLADENLNVWKMTYPNDQPVKKSAALFFKQLVGLNQNGINNIVIVAHSMGGLITREVLTNPDWQCKNTECAEAKIPHVDQLIMVGTPNHGSVMARFRMFAEIREQIERLIEGEAAWLDWIFDGAGEAGVDLIPGSAFLSDLNSRQHPEKTKYYVIAGVIGSEERQSLKKLLKNFPDHEFITGPIDTLLETIGDGLVTLESASLENIPVIVVSGNHLSIIRNVSRKSSRIPPAVPVIIKLISN